MNTILKLLTLSSVANSFVVAEGGGSAKAMDAETAVMNDADALSAAEPEIEMVDIALPADFVAHMKEEYSAELHTRVIRDLFWGAIHYDTSYSDNFVPTFEDVFDLMPAIFVDIEGAVFDRGAERIQTPIAGDSNIPANADRKGLPTNKYKNLCDSAESFLRNNASYAWMVRAGWQSPHSREDVYLELATEQRERNEQFASQRRKRQEAEENARKEKLLSRKTAAASISVSV